MLGNDKTKVSLFTNDGRFIMDLTRFMASGSYTRTKNAISTFTGQFNSDFDPRFSQVDHWSTFILCERDNIDQWYGPVTNFTESDGAYNIIGSDLTAYWTREFAPNATYNNRDIVSIVEDLLSKVFRANPYAQAEIDSVLAGITEDRAFLESEYKPISDIVAELTELSYFALGKTIYLRGKNDQTDSSLSLNDLSWSQLPTVEKAGNEYANVAIVKGASHTGVAEATTEELEHYGMIKRRIDLPDITTQAGVDQAAQEKLNQFRDTTKMIPQDGAVLNPDVPINLNELLPGILVDVDHSVTTQPLIRTLLLDSVTVDCMSTEGSGVSLQLVAPNPIEET